MTNYTDLGLSKQESLIVKTNGGSASRELYQDAAQIGILGRAPDSTNGSRIGLVVYTIHYEFSGQRAPNVSGPLPEPATVPVTPPPIQPSLLEQLVRERLVFERGGGDSSMGSEPQTKS